MASLNISNGCATCSTIDNSMPSMGQLMSVDNTSNYLANSISSGIDNGGLNVTNAGNNFYVNNNNKMQYNNGYNNNYNNGYNNGYGNQYVQAQQQATNQVAQQANQVVQQANQAAANQNVANTVAINNAINNAIRTHNNNNGAVSNVSVNRTANNVAVNRAVANNNNGNNNSSNFLGNIASETYTSSIFYINMGFTFAAALAWNEAVKFFINQSIKFNSGTPTYYLVYASVLTILAAVVYSFSKRYLSPEVQRQPVLYAVA